ncbi:hypothetical protein CYMTET_7593 [Cymbomonas tetramitiformis]|uniref:PH domain-containing protein n=1 Tax=Cymbomonas tetramitiformis TaxID=36881 RepID=A0AAE0GUQ1_9CHLO|nr:hypothetical protein CYMTET_7593 [Cymbomonas tetramitiformis]
MDSSVSSEHHSQDNDARRRAVTTDGRIEANPASGAARSAPLEPGGAAGKVPVILSDHYAVNSENSLASGAEAQSRRRDSTAEWTVVEHRASQFEYIASRTRTCTVKMHAVELRGEKEGAMKARWAVLEAQYTQCRDLLCARGSESSSVANTALAFLSSLSKAEGAFAGSWVKASQGLEGVGREAALSSALVALAGAGKATAAHIKAGGTAELHRDLAAQISQLAHEETELMRRMTVTHENAALAVQVCSTSFRAMEKLMRTMQEAVEASIQGGVREDLWTAMHDHAELLTAADSALCSLRNVLVLSLRNVQPIMSQRRDAVAKAMHAFLRKQQRMYAEVPLQLLKPSSSLHGQEPVATWDGMDEVPAHSPPEDGDVILVGADELEQDLERSSPAQCHDVADDVADDEAELLVVKEGPVEYSTAAGAAVTWTFVHCVITMDNFLLLYEVQEKRITTPVKFTMGNMLLRLDLTLPEVVIGSGNDIDGVTVDITYSGRQGLLGWLAGRRQVERVRLRMASRGECRQWVSAIKRVDIQSLAAA